VPGLILDGRDLDLSDGFAQLDAVITVPGGLGPMTVSMMVEEVIARAEVGASGP
jgi:5,10-methylene-tetrahydrofolate dehydrogenase/methenyl tetrahydrofolate cyclohydrolase